MLQVAEFPQLVGPSYNYDSVMVDCQECVNFEPVNVESPSSPYKHRLIGTPGTRRMKFRIKDTSDIIDYIPTGISEGEIRGVHRCVQGFGTDTGNLALVVVAGSYVWEVKPEDSNGVHTIVKLMEMPTSSGRVSIVDGGGDPGSNFPPKVLIVDGKYYSIINMDDYSSRVLAISSEGPLLPTCAAFLGGRAFTCGNDPTTGKPNGRVHWSAINDIGSWGLTDFVNASVVMDSVVSIKAINNMLWMIGTDSYEVWQTTTSSGSTLYSPIRKVTGAANAVGTCSADSVATIGNNIFFVGSSDLGHCRIYHGQDSNCKFISTDAIEEELSHYKSVSECHGFCYSDGGLTYYVITFDVDDVTWVYNVESKSWHKRSTWNKDGLTHKWNVDGAVLSNGRIVAGCSGTSMMFILDRDIYEDDGNPILRRRTCPHIVKNFKGLRHMSFTLDVEVGNGLSYGQGVTPKVMLRALDYGGNVPRDERWRDTGRMGAYKTRVKWNRLGTANDRVYEIRVSDPVKWVITGARIEYEESVGGSR